MKAKRFNAWVLSALLVVFTVFPQKPAQALGAFLIPLVAGITTSTMMGVASYCEVSSCFGPEKIGQSVASISMQETKDGAPINATLRIPTTDDPGSQDVAMPPPVALPSVAPNETRMWYGLGGAYSYKSAQAGCSSGYSTQPDITCQCNESTGSCLLFYNGSEAGSTSVLSITTVVCPAGYATSGAMCVLNSPRLATPDQKVDVARTSDGYKSGPSVDVDSGGSGLNVSASGGSGGGTPAPKVTVAVKNSKGEPVLLEITRNSDASTQITMSNQTDQGGQSVVKQTNVSISPESIVTSVNSSVAPGSIQGLDTATPSSVTNSGQQLNSSFPSDYAKSGEAKTAADSLKGSIDGIKDKLTNTENVSDPTLKEYSDPWGTTFNNLKGWQLPGHSSTCPTPGFSWNSRSFVFDSHCQLMSDHFGILTTAMSVVWSVLALFIVLGA